MLPTVVYDCAHPLALCLSHETRATSATRRCARRNAHNLLAQRTGRGTGPQPTVAVLALNEFSNGKAVRHFRVRRFARALAHTLTKKNRQVVSAEGFWLFRRPCQKLCSADYCTVWLPCG